MNPNTIPAENPRHMPSREERLASTAKYEGAMAIMWAMMAAFCGIWSYALSMGDDVTPMSILLGVTAMTLAVMCVLSARNALHHRHLLAQHRAFLSNMKPTNKL